MGSRSPNIWYFSFPWEPIYLGLSFLSDTSLNKPHWDIAPCKNINAGWVSNACGQAVWPPEYIFSLRTFRLCKLQALLLWRCRPHKRHLIHGGCFSKWSPRFVSPRAAKNIWKLPTKGSLKIQRRYTPKEAEGSCKGDPLKAKKEDGKGRGAVKSPASLHISEKSPVRKMPTSKKKKKKKKSKQKLS